MHETDSGQYRASWLWKKKYRVRRNRVFRYVPTATCDPKLVRLIIVFENIIMIGVPV